MNKSQSKFDPILDPNGLGMMKGIGVLGGIMFGSGGWELFLVSEFQSLPCDCTPVLPSLCVVGESSGDVEGVGDGDATLIPKMAMPALLASGGDDSGKRVEDARVSFFAPSRFGLEWAWVGVARVSLCWALDDAIGLGPLV